MRVLYEGIENELKAGGKNIKGNHLKVIKNYRAKEFAITVRYGETSYGTT